MRFASKGRQIKAEYGSYVEVRSLSFKRGAGAHGVGTDASIQFQSTKHTVDLAILQLTSSFIFTWLSLCPFTVMQGIWLGLQTFQSWFTGVDQCMTLVFLVLIMRQKVSKAAENLSTMPCISVLSALSAQSSACH